MVVEKRRYKRTKIIHPIRFWLKDKGLFKGVKNSATTEDISDGGICIRFSPEEVGLFRQGEIIHLRLGQPLARKSRDVIAKVAWMENPESKQDYRVGLSFEKVMWNRKIIFLSLLISEGIAILVLLGLLLVVL